MVAGSLVGLYDVDNTGYSLPFRQYLPSRPDNIPWTYPQTGAGPNLEPLRTSALGRVHFLLPCNSFAVSEAVDACF